MVTGFTFLAMADVGDPMSPIIGHHTTMVIGTGLLFSGGYGFPLNPGDGLPIIMDTGSGMTPMDGSGYLIITGLLHGAGGSMPMAITGGSPGTQETTIMKSSGKVKNLLIFN